MDKVKAQQLSDGLIWMPADLDRNQESSFEEFPFRAEVYADIASAMEDLAVLQRRRQRAFLLNENSDEVDRLGHETKDKKNEIHRLLIPDFDGSTKKRIKLSPYENYDTTGRYDFAALEKRFRNGDEKNFALQLHWLAGWSSERDEYVTRNDQNLGSGERIEGIKVADRTIAVFRNQLAFICGRDEFRKSLPQ